MSVRRRHRRPSATMVIAMIALVLATTGSAIAGSRLVTGGDVRDGSLSGADIRRASITVGDLAPQARPKSPTTHRATALGVGPLTVRCDADEVATGGGGSAPGMWRNEPIVDHAGRAIGWKIEGEQPAVTVTGTADGPPSAVADTVTTAWVLCVPR